MPRSPFPERRPYLFVALVEMMVVVVYLAAGTVAHFVAWDGIGLYALANATLAVLMVLLLTKLRWWHTVGFRRASAAQLLWVLPMLLPVIVNFAPGLAPVAPVQVAGFLAVALMVGFVEETVFRGVMLRALEPRGMWRAVLITTVLFSITHLMNVIAGEAGLQAVLQLLYAAAIGFAFTAIVLRTGLIWPLIIAHALIDFVAYLQDPARPLPPTIEITLDVAVTVVFFAYGLVLLTRSPITPRGADAGSRVPGS